MKLGIDECVNKRCPSYKDGESFNCLQAPKNTYMFECKHQLVRSIDIDLDNVWLTKDSELD